MRSSASHVTFCDLVQVQKAIIVETKKEVGRQDGSYLKFAQNSCVIVNAKKQPIGTRILGLATFELRKRNMLKVLSLATRVL